MRKVASKLSIFKWMKYINLNICTITIIVSGHQPTTVTNNTVHMHCTMNFRNVLFYEIIWFLDPFPQKFALFKLRQGASILHFVCLLIWRKFWSTIFPFPCEDEDRHEKTREHVSSARGNFSKLWKLFTNITTKI